MGDDRRSPLPPDALPAVATRNQLVAHGVTDDVIDGRVGRGRWQRVLPRVYCTTGEPTSRERLTAAVLFAGAGAALSGAAALFAAGVRRRSMPDRVLVLVPPENCAASWGWVQVRRTVWPYVIDPRSHPCHVEIARAAVDHALGLRRLDDVRAVVARVVQDRHCTIADLGAMLEHAPRRGSAHLRVALEDVGWGAASAPEARAARILRAAGIIGFEQNVELRLPDGRRRVVDFYWPALRACLEIDSVEFHFERDEWAGTWDRHLDLSTYGYSVVHRPPSALRDEVAFVRDVRAWLAGRETDLRRGLTSG